MERDVESLSDEELRLEWNYALYADSKPDTARMEEIGNEMSKRWKEGSDG